MYFCSLLLPWLHTSVLLSVTQKLSFNQRKVKYLAGQQPCYFFWQTHEHHLLEASFTVLDVSTYVKEASAILTKQGILADRTFIRCLFPLNLYSVNLRYAYFKRSVNEQKCCQFNVWFKKVYVFEMNGFHSTTSNCLIQCTMWFKFLTLWREMDVSSLQKWGFRCWAYPTLTQSRYLTIWERDSHNFKWHHAT